MFMLERYNKRGRPMPAPAELEVDGYRIRVVSTNSALEGEISEQIKKVIEELKTGGSVDSFNNYIAPKSLRVQITDPDQNITMVQGTVSLLATLKEIYRQKNMAELSGRFYSSLTV